MRRPLAKTIERVLESHGQCSSTFELSKVRIGLETYRRYESPTRNVSRAAVASCVSDGKKSAGTRAVLARIRSSPELACALARKGRGAAALARSLERERAGSRQLVEGARRRTRVRSLLVSTVGFKYPIWTIESSNALECGLRRLSRARSIVQSPRLVSTTSHTTRQRVARRARARTKPRANTCRRVAVRSRDS